jgi:predicted RND superfamily exporter protein
VSGTNRSRHASGFSHDTPASDRLIGVGVGVSVGVGVNVAVAVVVGVWVAVGIDVGVSVGVEISESHPVKTNREKAKINNRFSKLENLIQNNSFHP